MPTFTAPNALPYRSAVQTNARPAGPSTRRYPLPESCPIQFAAYAFDQEFEMVLSSFPPAAKNTPSNASSGATFGLSDANVILTKLSQPSVTLAGMGKFSGSFARVPAGWDNFETQTVNFPGWLNTFASGAYRDAKPMEVTVRVHYDYFVIDPDGVLAGLTVLDSAGISLATGSRIVASKANIPILRRTPWLATATIGGPAIANAEAKSLVVSTGVNVNSAGIAQYPPTVPSTEQYKSWCGIATTFMAGSTAWDSTHPPVWNGSSTTDVTSGQYILANSKLQDYEGNIVARISTYALAE